MRRFCHVKVNYYNNSKTITCLFSKFLITKFEFDDMGNFWDVSRKNASIVNIDFEGEIHNFSRG